MSSRSAEAVFVQLIEERTAPGRAGSKQHLWKSSQPGLMAHRDDGKPLSTHKVGAGGRVHPPAAVGGEVGPGRGSGLVDRSVSSHWQILTTLARWCRIRSHLDSAARLRHHSARRHP